MGTLHDTFYQPSLIEMFRSFLIVLKSPPLFKPVTYFIDICGPLQREKIQSFHFLKFLVCNCFVNGTMNTTRNGVEYLDCVRDDEEAAELGDLVRKIEKSSPRAKN